VIFRVEGATGSPDVYLVNPSGKEITPEFAAAHSDKYYYGVNPVTHDGGFIVRAPQAGDWQVVVQNSTEIGQKSVQVLGGNAPPQIELLKPSGDVQGPRVVIKWSAHDPDDNATISLYYDGDATGADGLLIETGISEDDGCTEYQWDVSELGAGQYYVYAVIDDGHAIPRVAYSSGVVTVGPVEQSDETLPSGSLEVVNAPNPIAGGQTTFIARDNQGGGVIQTIRVAVYSPTGGLLWEEEAGGARLGWDTTDQEGQLLASGVYYYIAVVKVDGQWYRAGPGVLLIVR